MASSRQVARLNQELQAHLGGDRLRDYDDIVVHLIYWVDGDADFKEEATRLEDFCRKKLGYQVSQYQIPSEGSQRGLIKRVADIFNESTSTRHLTIIHYGGHGNEDIESERRKGVWAAKDEGGPTLL